MTIGEAGKHYNIPIEIIREYESLGLCGKLKEKIEACRCDNKDLERLSLIMTLHDIGFDKHEIKTYMQLREQSGSESRLLGMLNQKRVSTLEDIHLKEHSIERLDYLRYNITKNQKDKPKP